MENIKKRLVFHFYLPNEGYETGANELHLRCLKKYSSIFDEVIIVIVHDEGIDTQKIINLEKKLSTIFQQSKVTFKTAKNTYLRDSKTFYDEIASKMDELDGITFFAHNKGLTNINSGKFEKEKIYKWVAALYFGCLDFYNEAEFCLTELRCFGYGALFDIVDINFVENKSIVDILYSDLGKYSYLYTGTFFWINTQCLKGFMDRKGIELPKMVDRWYAENFFSNIIEPHFCSTRNGVYAKNYLGGRECIEELIDMCFVDNDLKKFENFYKEITEGL